MLPHRPHIPGPLPQPTRPRLPPLGCPRPQPPHHPSPPSPSTKARFARHDDQHDGLHTTPARHQAAANTHRLRRRRYAMFGRKFAVASLACWNSISTTDIWAFVEGRSFVRNNTVSRTIALDPIAYGELFASNVSYTTEQQPLAVWDPSAQDFNIRQPYWTCRTTYSPPAAAVATMPPMKQTTQPRTL